MPSIRPAPVELLATLAPVLAARGDRWYVFGAQAVLVWGRSRLTADVDVTVQLAADDPVRAIKQFMIVTFAFDSRRLRQRFSQ